MSRRRRDRPTRPVATPDPAERMTFVVVMVVMAAVPALTFLFSFGNVWALARRLDVPTYVQPLVAPAVDLSVGGLFVALSYLTLRGVPREDLRPARRLLHASGLATLALNCAEPIISGHHGRAAFDAVGPLMLIGWGAVGPMLLRLVVLARTLPMIRTVPEPSGASGTVRPDEPDSREGDAALPSPPADLPGIDPIAQLAALSVVRDELPSVAPVAPEPVPDPLLEPARELTSNLPRVPGRPTLVSLLRGAGHSVGTGRAERLVESLRAERERAAV